MSNYIATSSIVAKTDRNGGQYFSINPGDQFEMIRTINGVTEIVITKLIGIPRVKLKVYSNVMDMRNKYKRKIPFDA